MKVYPNEQVLPKKKTPYIYYGIWKVTARYNVQISTNKFLKCIRVRGPYNGNWKCNCITFFRKRILKIV